MNWIFAIGIISIILILVIDYYKKNKLKELIRDLENNWGNIKDNEYLSIDAVRRYFDNNLHKTKAYHLISDSVANDLDIDALFKYLDRTCSRIGQQYLYFKLRTIESIDKLKRFDKLVELFIKNDDLRRDTQLVLSSLNSPYGYDLEQLINDEPLQKPAFLKYIYLSSAAAILFIISGFFNPIFFLLLVFVYAFHSFLHYQNKQDVTRYTNAVNQLSKTLKVANNLATKEEIKSHFGDLSFLKKTNAIQFKTSFIAFEKKLTDEYASAIWLVLELLKIQFMIEYMVFYSFIDSIIKEREYIDQLFLFIGEIDTALSTASLKSGRSNICKPVFHEENRISTKEISHPLISKCIPNDLHLEGKSLLLTGSNMSGKTTFIRTVAINTILAQTLSICFAQQYEAPFLKVHSSIRIADDLLNDESYYLKEVLIIKELIDAAKDKAPCLFILDEIFKGTNTIERVSGGKAILSYLNRENHIVFVSTHDIELTTLLEKDNYDLYHFNEIISQEKLYFDHKLKPGKLRTRNALKILELYDYPDSIVQDARETERQNFNT